MWMRDIIEAKSGNGIGTLVFRQYSFRAFTTTISSITARGHSTTPCRPGWLHRNSPPPIGQGRNSIGKELWGGRNEGYNCCEIFNLGLHSVALTSALLHAGQIMVYPPPLGRLKRFSRVCPSPSGSGC